MLVASRGAAGLSRFGNLPENQNSVQEEKKNIQCLKLDLVNIGDKMFSQLSHWSSVVRTEEEWYRLDLQYNNCFLLQPDWILTLPNHAILLPKESHANCFVCPSMRFNCWKKLWRNFKS